MTWLTLTLSNLLKDYSLQDVFITNEVGLIYHCLPSETLAFNSDGTQVGKVLEKH